MGQAYRRTKKTVSLIHYHFVFCPRNHRKALINKWKSDSKVGERHLSGKRLGYPCHGSDMAKLKGVTSRKLRQEFNHLSHPSLWTRPFFVSTAGNVSR
ncbi:transposase [Polycladomyces subterraneus]|uniref:Transposase n=1 Tax=Polycladomyces subterraneus TaxID=1016997 RepID=A0ABT8IPS6_9BACL|nr:transposase [Polycladomyces subterraneus]MDN4594745.1 transposase [Polycladomyces subterraneus]